MSIGLGGGGADCKQTASDSECVKVGKVIGFSRFIFDKNTVLEFYESPSEEGNPAQTVRFFTDEDGIEVTFRAEGPKKYPALDPKQFKLDYNLFLLEVVEKKGDWIKVIVDFDGNATLWIRTDASTKFEDWLTYMKAQFALERSEPENFPIRESPALTAPTVSSSGRDCFEVLEMKGDWIKVRSQPYCGESTDEHKEVNGWIRWRGEDDCLLVNMFPFA